MVKSMKMLDNSTQRLLLYQTYLLYKTCVFSIILYGFPLYMPLSYSLNKLNKMQQRASLWILRVFCISPTIGIEAIADLIPIYLHL